LKDSPRPYGQTTHAAPRTSKGPPKERKGEVYRAFRYAILVIRSGFLAEHLKVLLAELADWHPVQLVNLFPHRSLIAVNLVSMTVVLQLPNAPG
jgi:hypothetical protein